MTRLSRRTATTTRFSPKRLPETDGAKVKQRFNIEDYIILFFTVYRAAVVRSKCLQILLYSLEACPLTKTDLKSLDFVINKF